MPLGGDAMSVSKGEHVTVRKKKNVVLYLDKELVENARQIGFNLSKTVENHLKKLILQNSNDRNLLVRSTGFEPVIASLEGLCPKPARRRPLWIKSIFED